MKVLVDTSVWIEHFRSSSNGLARLLEEDAVIMHPFVLGEIACGNLRNRTDILGLMSALPSAPKAGDDEFLFFIDQNRLMGKGLGFVDIHLLASCQIAGCTLWTADKTLKQAAERLK